MQRDKYDPVTTPIAVLIPSASPESDGRATWEHGFGRMKTVRALTDRDLNKLDLNDLDRNQFLGVIGLAKALQAKDPIAIKKACKRLLGGKDGQIKALVRELMDGCSRDPELELSKLVSDVLRSADLKLWWFGGKFLPALFCPDIKTALYVQALLSIVGGKALLVCPHCGKPFIQERSDQDYCSVRCREAHRVARWREKQKGKLSTKNKAAHGSSGSSKLWRKSR